VTPTGARRLDLVEVEVAGPDGGTMRLSRLVERGR